jgi:3-(3-hydroxy-phenyl)propionate hydroxylase
MCSGIRDAANLAWKLAMILKGEAKPSLLDTYLKERAPHVRSIIESAIGVGRMICTLDHEVARRRDSDLLAARDAGQAPPDVNSLIPSLIEGCLSPSPRSGQLFPQPVLRGVRLDDLTGDRFALLTLGKPPENLPAYVKCIEIEGISELADWQRDVGAEAVLVRPDRYIFGTGGGRDLIERLRECLEAGAFSV